MNILTLITPKADLAYLSNKLNARQALEKMHAHHYACIPMINKEGEYLGSLSEGDFLRYVINSEESALKALEEIKAIDLIRQDFMPALRIDASYNDLITNVMEQNYVPIIDDRNILVGIITRKSVIAHFSEVNKNSL